MSGEITVTGTAAIEARIDAMLVAKRAAIVAAINKAAFDTEAAAKLASPVDTGFMKNSITAVPGELESHVSVGARYAWYVELGHHTHSGSFVPPQPFLFPAFVKNARVLKDVLKRIMEA
jgi:hypothetical protein